MSDYQTQINALNESILGVIEEYNGKVYPYEIGHAMILQAVGMLLATAPNQLLAITTVMASVQSGIAFYKENHCGCSNETTD